MRQATSTTLAFAYRAATRPLILLPVLLAATAYGCSKSDDDATTSGAGASAGGQAGLSGAPGAGRAGAAQGASGSPGEGGAKSSEGGASSAGAPVGGEAGIAGADRGAGGAGAGGEGGVADHGCASPDTTDTDHDGIADACDPDDDNDGFPDAEDPAPLDPTIPGDFSTPEAFLNDPRVQTALQGAEDAGVTIVTHTERNAPDVSGYYVTPDLGGQFVVTGDGTDIGRSIAGSEIRDDSGADDTIDQAWVGFNAGSPIGYGVTRGQLLRGTGSEITVYSRGEGVCTDGGSNYSYWFIAIGSATIESGTGNWVDQAGLTVNVATKGTLTTACKNRLAGNVELEGGWAVSTIPLTQKVAPSALQYMCVDGSAAYAPEETWARASGQACACGTDYRITCK